MVTSPEVEERLVVVDVMDRAIYIGDPLLDEWQEFSERMSVPETTVHDSGLQATTNPALSNLESCYDEKTLPVNPMALYPGT